MTDYEMYEMICRMKQYGGSFVFALANAFRMADPMNRSKLLNAFPEYVNEYGPNSKLPVKEF